GFPVSSALANAKSSPCRSTVKAVGAGELRPSRLSTTGSRVIVVITALSGAVGVRLRHRVSRAAHDSISSVPQTLGLSAAANVRRRAPRQGERRCRRLGSGKTVRRSHKDRRRESPPRSGSEAAWSFSAPARGRTYPAGRRGSPSDSRAPPQRRAPTLAEHGRRLKLPTLPPSQDRLRVNLEP